MVHLEKGQKIRVVLYNGASMVEADVLYRYLDDHRIRKQPIPLTGTNFKIDITNIEREENGSAVYYPKTSYRVILEGMLV